MARVKGHIEAQKTVILRVRTEAEYREEIAKHIASTKQLYADTTEFYVLVFLDNLALLNLKSDDLYNVLEKLTLITKQRPNPESPLHINTDVARLFQMTMNKSLERVDYNTGAPNYICSETIEHRGNADLNAARNIGLRFFARYYEKPTLKAERQGLFATQATRKAFGMVAV